MALEWLEGETLAMHLARRRAEGPRGRAPIDALEFVRPVLLAMAYAHKQAIVHRDIKPANIMVTQTAHGPSLRVLDFGIAKIMADDKAPATGHTRTESAPAFSPSYAAPEQVAFSRTGPWTDVHGLGLILTELMTDEAPFSDADPDLHVFEQVMLKDRPTPASKGRDVGIFEPVIAKAMALSPKDRWKDAGELLAALDDAAAGKPMATPVAARGRRSNAAALGRADLRRGFARAAGRGWAAIGIGRAPAARRFRRSPSLAPPPKRRRRASRTNRRRPVPPPRCYRRPGSRKPQTSGPRSARRRKRRPATRRAVPKSRRARPEICLMTSDDAA